MIDPQISQTEGQPRRVFLSYSRKDKSWLDALLAHLAPLVDEGLIELWYDGEGLEMGDVFRKEIRDAIDTSSIAILLVSRDFQNSSFIKSYELPRLQELSDSKAIKLYWIPIGQCLLAERFQSLYNTIDSPDRPLNERTQAEVDKAFHQVCREVESAVKRELEPEVQSSTPGGDSAKALVTEANSTKKSRVGIWIASAFLVIALGVAGFVYLNPGLEAGTEDPLDEVLNFRGISNSDIAANSAPVEQPVPDNSGEKVEEPPVTETLPIPESAAPDDLMGTLAGEIRKLAGIPFVWCPPGEFQMGSENGDEDELPVHPVKFEEGFWMAQTEVTQLQWRSVMNQNPSSFAKGSSFPVENITWEEAKDFAETVNGQFSSGGPEARGWEIRLPTEAEWEYACRAGDFSEEGHTLDEFAWYRVNSGSETHPVKQKRANSWGLYDMQGNVWEWCLDWYAPYPTGAEAEGDRRIFRGGGWFDEARHCRPANRGRYVPTDKSSDTGVRLVCTPVRD